MAVVFLVLLVAAAAIAVGAVVAGTGRGGELTLAGPDRPALQVDLRTPSDVTMLRLPIGLLGYQQQATGEALALIARMLAARDAEIARLRDQIRDVDPAASPGERSPVPVRPSGTAGSHLPAGGGPSAATDRLPDLPDGAGEQPRRA